MSVKTTMQTLTTISDEDWFKKFYRKSNSEGAVNVAKISLNIFDQFCQSEIELNGESGGTMIKNYQDLFNQNRPDIRSICISLDKFVGFMSEDHEDCKNLKGMCECRCHFKKDEIPKRKFITPNCKSNLHSGCKQNRKYSSPPFDA